MEFVYDRDEDYPLQTLCETLHRVFFEQDAFLVESGWMDDALNEIQDLKETLDSYEDCEDDDEFFNQEYTPDEIIDQMKTLIKDFLLHETFEHYRQIEGDFFRIRSDENNAEWWLSENKKESFAMPLVNTIQEFWFWFEKAMTHDTSYLEKTIGDIDKFLSSGSSDESKTYETLSLLDNVLSSLSSFLNGLEPCYPLVRQIIQQWTDVAETIENYPWYVIRIITENVLR
jgi:hypothetical protein